MVCIFLKKLILKKIYANIKMKSMQITHHAKGENENEAFWYYDNGSDLPFNCVSQVLRKH